MREAAVKSDDIARMQTWAGQSAAQARPIGALGVVLVVDDDLVEPADG